jgi:DNA polymerase elongation subunit (family B)
VDSFYINAFVHKNKIYYTGYQNGKRVKHKVHYKPYLFLPSKKESEWTGFNSGPVERMEFDSIWDARKFVKEYSDVSDFNLFGNTNFLYVWLNDTFPGEVLFDPSLINVIYLDIEVASDQGLPDFKNANKEITAITVSRRGKKITFGCRDFISPSDDIMYVRCVDEHDLLTKFLQLWTNKKYNPDVITGWNVEGFDIPYLYERIRYLFDQDIADKLSPWGIVETREVFRKGGRVDTVYDLKGIATLDYLHLYKKFTYTAQESYALNFISHVELGEKKVDYSEYESLLELYHKNPQKFFEYNIHDVTLVERLESKMRLIELVFTMAYGGKVLFSDTLTTVRLWDTIIHNYLFEKQIAVPNTQPRNKVNIMGGYVKEPTPGMYKWVVSFDLTSLYPHLVMQYNIGPDTFMGKLNAATTMSVDAFYEGKLAAYKDELVSRDVCCTANRCLYRRDKAGVLAELMYKVFQDRDAYKQKMITAEKKYEATKDESLKDVIAKYNNLQMAKKIQINALYGVLANEFFRFYDADNAEAVTASGQFVIRSIARDINVYMNKLLKTKDVDYCIASDTDSIYVSFDAIVNKQWSHKPTEEIVTAIDEACKKHIHPFIDKCCEQIAEYTNAFKQSMHMKRECITDKVIWTTKKRYILNIWDKEGVRYKEPKLKFTGIEAVRSSTPSSCREKLKEAIKVIMNGDQTELQKFVADFKADFKQMAIVDIAKPTICNNVKKYADPARIFKKGSPGHVGGALMYNHLLEKHGLDKTYPLIFNSDKVKWVYLKIPNPTHHSKISFINVIPKQLGLDKYIDYDMQFEKVFLNPISFITDAIGWKVEEEATLEGFGL